MAKNMIGFPGENELQYSHHLVKKTKNFADIAIAHLAGALGQNVWTLIPDEPIWHWMLKGENSLCIQQ